MNIEYSDAKDDIYDLVSRLKSLTQLELLRIASFPLGILKALLFLQQEGRAFKFSLRVKGAESLDEEKFAKLSRQWTQELKKPASLVSLVQLGMGNNEMV